MKIFIVFLLLFCTWQICIAQDSLFDVFPLKVGNTWVYDFNTRQTAAGIRGYYADTGIATIKIVGVIQSADSNRWQFFQQRTFIEYSVFEPPIVTTAKSDSKPFEIIELLKNNHEIYTSVLDSFGPFPLGYYFFPRLNRYSITNTDGYAFFSRDTGGPYGFWPYNLEMILCRDTGVVQSNGHGVYAGGGSATEMYTLRRNMTVESVQDLSENKDYSYILNQNFPNPFNPSTTISYTIPINSYITLKIYNLFGEEIATIYSGYREKGTFSNVWETTLQSSGVYFCRLTAGNYAITKKMLFIK